MTDQKLSDHFLLSELCVSDKAKQLGIANTPTSEHLTHMKMSLCPVLEVIRSVVSEHRGKDTPVHVNSAYRNPEVNKAVKGTPTSAHPMGYAADLKVDGMDAKDLATLIAGEMKRGRLKGRIDQLILESSRHVVHVSTDPRTTREGHPRGQMGHQPGAAFTNIDWQYFAKA